MTSLAVGIVGTGFAASSHIDALRRLPEVRVAAIAASSRAKADTMASNLGIARSFGNYRDLLADDSVQAIHNCTPNHLHAEINEAAIAAGKHVLSEKPLGMNGKETARLRGLAAGSGVVTGVCFNYRHYPLVSQARALVRSGECGTVHYVHGSYLQDWLLLPGDWNWRLDSSRAGASRALADIGSHWLDLVQYVLDDRVVEVCGDLSTLHTERLRPSGDVHTFARSGEVPTEPAAVDTEDFASVLLRFSSGLRGAFNVSQVSAGRKNRLWFEVDAAHCALAWDQEQPNSLWIGRRDEANRELPRDPGLLEPEAARLAHFPAGHQEGWPDGLRNLFLDFYGAVAARAAGVEHSSSFATFEEAHRVLRIVESIVESHRANRWVEVEGAEAG